MAGMQQTLEVTLLAVQPVSIHQSVYYEVTYQVVGGSQQQTVRINPEAFYANPKPGDRVSVNVLMGNIMGATKLSSALDSELNLGVDAGPTA